MRQQVPSSIQSAKARTRPTAHHGLFQRRGLAGSRTKLSTAWESGASGARTGGRPAPSRRRQLSPVRGQFHLRARLHPPADGSIERSQPAAAGSPDAEFPLRQAGARRSPGVFSSPTSRVSVMNVRPPITDSSLTVQTRLQTSNVRQCFSAQ